MASQSKAWDDGVEIGSVRIEPAGPAGVALTGEIDLSNAEGVPEAIAEMVSAEGTLSIDLSRLRFIDSTGVQMLLGVAKAYGERGDRLVLDRPQGVVRRVFEVMQIERAPELEIRWG